MATNSSNFVWKTPWTVELGRQWSTWSQNQTQLKWLSMHYYYYHYYHCLIFHLIFTIAIKIDITILIFSFTAKDIKKLSSTLQFQNTECHLLLIPEPMAYTCIWLFETLWTVAQLFGPWDFSGKNTGVCFHFFLQEIFPTQGSNLSLLCLLHCRQIVYHWAIGEAQWLS